MIEKSDGKINEVFENIKERLSNPLVFSFIISWLICNWEVTVALIRYDKAQIKAEGYKSIFEFIQNRIDNRWDSFALPLILALVYTFGMPYLREFIDFSNKKALIVGQRFKTTFLKDSLHSKIQDLENKLYKIKDYRQLEGNWSVKRENKIYGETGEVLKTETESYEIYIEDNLYYLVEKDSKKLKYYLNDFYYNPLENDLIFILETYNPLTNIVTKLRLQNGNLNWLKGIEDKTEIEYKKYK